MDYLLSHTEYQYIKDLISTLKAEIETHKQAHAKTSEQLVEALHSNKVLTKQLNTERHTTNLVLNKLQELNCKLARYAPKRILLDELVLDAGYVITFITSWLYSIRVSLLLGDLHENTYTVTK